ncbi:hypothetical protein MRB53_039197 [Persea americana]|nr:hypothetical protein MRB53_039197 [Persea americana]
MSLTLPAVIPAKINSDLIRLTTESNPLSKYFDRAGDKIAFIAECQAKYNDSEKVKELEDALREIIDLRKDYDAVRLNAKHVYDNRRTDPGNIHEDILAKTEVDKINWRELPEKLRYGKSSIYDDFKRRVFDIEHPNEDYPGIDSFFDKRRAADDDMQMTYGTKRNLRCPLTFVYFVEPVRTAKCVHVFSKEAIVQMIRQQGGRCECPVPGCGKVLMESDLQRDKVMERRVREEAEQEENFDAEALSDDDRDILTL